MGEAGLEGILHQTRSMEDENAAIMTGYPALVSCHPDIRAASQPSMATLRSVPQR
jgi:hypothetical protein